MDFTEMLPEECLSIILSFTSPVDACRAALVCPALRSAVNSNALWERFLPHDYKEIISRSSSQSLLSLPKKNLYLHLCSHHILIENGAMSLQLEKKTGKKRYMIGAEALGITWGNVTQYWTHPSHPLSRFSKVAELVMVWWLNVWGGIESRKLSTGTNYAAYLVFMFDEDSRGFRDRTVSLKVKGQVEKRFVILDPPEDVPQLAREREDGWMEVEIGEFFNDQWGDDGLVEFYLWEHDCSYSKHGLIIEGIEVRPKDIGRKFGT